MVKNYRKIIALSFILSCGILIAGFVVDDLYPIQRIAIQLNKWSTNYPIEKVYLHFDKPYYAAGDDIWFKAYVTVGSRHQLTALSGVLNVELIDDKDSVKQSLKLPMFAGLTWGDFALPDTLAEGNYRIRAYTNWMRNAGEGYFFDKTISIANTTINNVFTKTAFTYTHESGQQRVDALVNYTDINGTPYANKAVQYSVELDGRSVIKGKGVTDNDGNINIAFINGRADITRPGRINTNIKIADKQIISKSILIKATSANTDVQFFPEGGQLVNGISTKVAFKAVGADGLGDDIKGTILDEQNNTVATFASMHLGMGVFNLYPQAGKAYRAHVIFADGSFKDIDMPQAIDKGYGLWISNNNPDFVRVKISTSLASFAEHPNDTLSIIGQSGGEILYAAKSHPGSPNFAATIPASRFPSGVVQFTLFSAKGEPLCERLVFIQNADQLKLDVAAQKPVYGTGQKVKINFTAKSTASKPAEGSFSVAVVDETKVTFDETDESTILSNLLLTSDLKGYIEKPNYYFTDTNATTRASLDVLMLTQGYHRFEWKRILNNDFEPIVYQPEKTLQISGRLETLGGKPIANGKVTVLSTSGGTFLLDTVTDGQGRFMFNNLVFNDSMRFVIQARTGKNHSNAQIVLNNIDLQKVTQNKNAPDMQVSIYNGLSAYLKSNKAFYNEQIKYGLGNHSIVLKEVVIRDKKPVLKNSSNLNGAGNADQVLTSEQFFGCSTLEQCLNGKLMGVVFRTAYLIQPGV